MVELSGEAVVKLSGGVVVGSIVVLFDCPAVLKNNEPVNGHSSNMLFTGQIRNLLQNMPTLTSGQINM